MKTLLLVAVIFFASCSSESDPSPKYNCEELKSDSDQAHASYQAATKVTLLPTAPDYEVEKWQANVSTKKEAYVEAYKLWSENCK
jgi:hypothetical protein